jgi:outer membrane immunogenic protein
MRKTLKLLVGFGLAGTALVAAAPGQAADIYRQPPSIKDVGPVDYAPAITWTGFYLGGNIGATWPSDDLEILNDDAQFIGGVHLGWNWQTPTNWVFGVEGDANFGDDFDYLASVRGRLGYSFGRTLLYGTGGVAFAGFSNDLFDDDEVGWVAGGGVETKIRDNLSLGLEALYYDFQDVSVGNGLAENEVDALTVRGRLTIHMNGDRGALK